MKYFQFEFTGFVILAYTKIKKKLPDFKTAATFKSKTSEHKNPICSVMFSFKFQYI